MLKLQLAELILRTFTGILFIFQGYDKLFNIKIKNIVETYLSDAELHHVHKPVVTMVTLISSVIEFVCGITLLTGTFTNISLVLLGADLVLVSIAFSIVETMWDMKHVFPRLLLVITLLLIPSEWNRFSIDNLLHLNLK